MKGTVLCALLACFFVFAFSVYQEGNAMQVAVVNGFRIELHVGGAEPFFTKEEAAAKKAKKGMLIAGGAMPAALDLLLPQTRHLGAHIYDAKTGKAITSARVTLRIRPLDGKGNPAGGWTEVPIVIMETIGQGRQSTHYGNNATMPAGHYEVYVAVNGKKTSFKIDLVDQGRSINEKKHLHK